MGPSFLMPVFSASSCSRFWWPAACSMRRRPSSFEPCFTAGSGALPIRLPPALLLMSSTTFPWAPISCRQLGR
eukprot:4095945-Heterocapsa_arctica.AAC.1